MAIMPFDNNGQRSFARQKNNHRFAKNTVASHRVVIYGRRLIQLVKQNVRLKQPNTIDDRE